jgi:hypothetical protein
MLKPTYTGIQVLKTPSGDMVRVLVRDTAGNNTELSAKKYRAQNIKPPIESLPVVIQGVC